MSDKGGPVEASEVRGVENEWAAWSSRDASPKRDKKYCEAMRVHTGEFREHTDWLHYAERTPRYLSSYKPACTNG